MYSVSPSPKIHEHSKTRPRAFNNLVLETEAVTFKLIAGSPYLIRQVIPKLHTCLAWIILGERILVNFYGVQFNPYWLPITHYQPGQPAVLVVQVPVPVTLQSHCFDPDIIAAGNQGIPVINSVFSVNNTTSKSKPGRKGRKKRS